MLVIVNLVGSTFTYIHIDECLFKAFKSHTSLNSPSSNEFLTNHDESELLLRINLAYSD